MTYNLIKFGKERKVDQKEVSFLTDRIRGLITLVKNST